MSKSKTYLSRQRENISLSFRLSNEAVDLKSLVNQLSIVFQESHVFQESQQTEQREFLEGLFQALGDLTDEQQ